MKSIIPASILAIITFATLVGCHGAPPPAESSSAPPFLALTVAVVDQTAAGSATAVVVWGPLENGTDHLILIPQERVSTAELRRAAAMLFAVVQSGSSHEPGTRLRVQGFRDHAGAPVRTEQNTVGGSLAWVLRTIENLEVAERRHLAGFGDVPYVLTVVQVE